MAISDSIILHQRGSYAAHEGQEPRIVMWAYALRLALPWFNDGVLNNLATVLHVRVRVVELS